MWVRLQLDFGALDLAHGLSRLVLPSRRASLSQSIENCWSDQGKAVAVLSVRSGFDLFLDTIAWPTESEIIFSALNIPDMPMVARQHGIVPIPADIDPETLAPDLASIERAITPRTRAILIAHLYGSFVPLEPIAALARERGLMLIEDCAEVFDGVYLGHPSADLSLFSFGPLKTATALAGGVIKVADTNLASQLRANHERWPRQSRWDYCKRLSKYGTMRLFGSKWLYGGVRRVARLAVGDVEKLIHHSAKSFREDEIMTRLRQQPCGPLLAAMARRLRKFDPLRVARRTANGKLLASLLSGHVFCPGADVSPHNFWLFAAVVAEPAKTIAALESAGFDATRAESMIAIEAPPDRPECDPKRTREMLQHMILLPCYAGIPEAELRRMAEVVITVEREAPRMESARISLDAAPQTHADALDCPAAID